MAANMDRDSPAPYDLQRTLTALIMFNGERALSPPFFQAPAKMLIHICGIFCKVMIHMGEDELEKFRFFFEILLLILRVNNSPN